MRSEVAITNCSHADFWAAGGGDLQTRTSRPDSGDHVAIVVAYLRCKLTNVDYSQCCDADYFLGCIFSGFSAVDPLYCFIYF